MPKATVPDLQEEGWRAEQFGGGFATPVDFAAYLATVIDEAGRWATAKIGAVLYAATVTPSYAFDCLKRAELCLAAMRQCKRRGSLPIDHHLRLTLERLDRRTEAARLIATSA